MPQEKLADESIHDLIQWRDKRLKQVNCLLFTLEIFNSCAIVIFNDHISLIKKPP